MQNGNGEGLVAPTPLDVTYYDGSAPEHERTWTFGPATIGPGIRVQAKDDAGIVFDELTLRRFGAFITLEPQGKDAPDNLPESLEFLRPAIVARARLRMVGVLQEPGPLLVNSTNVRRALELGHFPKVMVAKFPKHGNAEFYGVRVTWHEDLDSIVPLQ